MTVDSAIIQRKDAKHFNLQFKMASFSIAGSLIPFSDISADAKDSDALKIESTDLKLGS